MPRIAIFISGRITCYDTDLKPVITELSRQYEIGLFISVNGFKKVDIYTSIILKN